MMRLSILTDGLGYGPMLVVCRLHNHDVFYHRFRVGNPAVVDAEARLCRYDYRYAKLDSSVHALELLLFSYYHVTFPPVLVVVVTAVTLPLINIAFALQIVMGDQREPFTLASIVGLILVVAGATLYGYYRDPRQFQRAKVKKKWKEQAKQEESLLLGGRDVFLEEADVGEEERDFQHYEKAYWEYMSLPLADDASYWERTVHYCKKARVWCCFYR